MSFKPGHCSALSKTVLGLYNLYLFNGTSQISGVILCFYITTGERFLCFGGPLIILLWKSVDVKLTGSILRNVKNRYPKKIPHIIDVKGVFCAKKGGFFILKKG